MVITENNIQESPGPPAPASLEILTGPARGTATWLNAPALDVSLNNTDMIRISAAGSEPQQDNIVAALNRSDKGYQIEARGQTTLWINGQPVDAKQLEQRDLIEFGDNGPLTRYRSYHQGDRVRRSLGDMLGDCIDYTRVSRKPRITRWQNALTNFGYDFALQTTFWFRSLVLVSLVVLSVVTWQQYRSDIELQQQAETSANQMEDFSRALTRTNREALRASDLSSLRQEMGRSLTSTTERLEQLEKRSAASSRIIAAATRSIVFLQGAYGFRDLETQRLMRFEIDEQGRPIFNHLGQPMLSPDGEGEIAQREFTGTAFLVNASGALLTNRHVAMPWEEEASPEAFAAQGVEAVLTRFQGFLPGIETAFPVELLQASDEADLAVLLCKDLLEDLPHLQFSSKPAAPGDEVIVMGYPTGLRTMLAQTGDSFLEELEKTENLDFWGVAERLSQAQFIQPLASRGIIGQRSESILVYDAETTHGGSGGPVLDIDGKVIAINTAIIPEYGGSNFGVPIEYARRLFVSAKIEVDSDPG